MSQNPSSGLRIDFKPFSLPEQGSLDDPGRNVAFSPPSSPLVSIVIPAYNSFYFTEALAGCLCQDYDNLEILVCDDSPGEEIMRAVKQFQDRRIKYIKNPYTLGFSGNFTNCFKLASGEFIKFLNDDDILHPKCISSMVRQFQLHDNRLKLVTSKRRIIDCDGRPQDDAFYTRPLAVVESYMKGISLGDHVLRHSTNFIGEPTTAMFRKSDLDVEGDSIFRWDNHEYHCLADLSLWFRLMSKGDVLYIPEELSFFRVHEKQEQKKPAVAITCVTDRYHILKSARAVGFLRDINLHREALSRAIGIFDRALADRNLFERYGRDLWSCKHSLARDLQTINHNG